MTTTCGGCRARAYGVTGDYMAEDPLCTHEPGTFPAARELQAPQIQYGEPATESIQWEAAARARMKQIPAFVRGMVTRSVESHCRKNDIQIVTSAVLDEIRSRMPTTRIFGRKPPN